MEYLFLSRIKSSNSMNFLSMPLYLTVKHAVQSSLMQINKGLHALSATKTTTLAVYPSFAAVLHQRRFLSLKEFHQAAKSITIKRGLSCQKSILITNIRISLTISSFCWLHAGIDILQLQFYQRRPKLMQKWSKNAMFTESL